MSFIFTPFFSVLIIHFLFFRLAYTFETTKNKSTFCIFKGEFMLRDYGTQQKLILIDEISFRGFELKGLKENAKVHP